MSLASRLEYRVASGKWKRQAKLVKKDAHGLVMALGMSSPDLCNAIIPGSVVQMRRGGTVSGVSLAKGGPKMARL